MLVSSECSYGSSEQKVPVVAMESSGWKYLPSKVVLRSYGFDVPDTPVKDPENRPETTVIPEWKMIKAAVSVTVPLQRLENTGVLVNIKEPGNESCAELQPTNYEVTDEPLLPDQESHSVSEQVSMVIAEDEPGIIDELDSSWVEIRTLVEPAVEIRKIRPRVLQELNVSRKISDLMKAHALDRPKILKCPQCDYVTPKSADFRLHLSLHAGGKNFKCEECPRAFRHHAEYQQHRFTHRPRTPFACQYCRQCFETEHELHHHGKAKELERSFKCNECDKDFKYEKNLEMHRKYHLLGKPFPCPICSKLFSRKDLLAVHEKNHTGERHICGGCSKAFTRSEHLKKHQGSCTLLVFRSRKLGSTLPAPPKKKSKKKSSRRTAKSKRKR